jgi:hypothetical protein
MITIALGFRVTSHWFLLLPLVSLYGTTRQQHILPYERVLFVRDVRVYLYASYGYRFSVEQRVNIMADTLMFTT